jgi:hypothetical protein
MSRSTLVLLALALCEHGAGLMFMQVSIPQRSDRLVLSQVFSSPESIQLASRNPSAAASLYFPFVSASVAYRTSFGSFFLLDNINPAATVVSVPFCSLDLGVRNCVFQNISYQLTVYDANGNMSLTREIITPTLIQYAANRSSFSAASFGINGSLTLPTPSDNNLVARRHIFFYYKNFGNVAEVRASGPTCMHARSWCASYFIALSTRGIAV